MKATFDKDRNVATVSLSERNLLALMAQLKDPDRPAPALFKFDGEIQILVQAQSDEDHYAGQEAGPLRAATESGMTKAAEYFEVQLRDE